jgi:hypothetical protein
MREAASLDETARELDRIESQVRRGRSDLAALGFWRVLARVKADPAAAARFADQAGRIDAAAFEARVSPRFPVWVGNLVLLAGIGAGAAALIVAGRTQESWIAGTALVVAAGVWAASVHCLAHWVVGRAVGIRFLCYFFGGPPPPRPGLKTDAASYLRTNPRARAWMHASGAIATKIAPFVVLVLPPARGAPAWSIVVVLVIGVGQIVTDALFSVKTSDWKRFRREMAIARSQGLTTN